MENKEIDLRTANDLNLPITISLVIAVCGVLTNEQCERIAVSLRNRGDHFVETSTDARALAVGAILQALADVALGRPDVAVDVLSPLVNLRNPQAPAASPSSADPTARS